MSTFPEVGILVAEGGLLAFYAIPVWAPAVESFPRRGGNHGRSGGRRAVRLERALRRTRMGNSDGPTFALAARTIRSVSTGMIPTAGTTSPRSIRWNLPVGKPGHRLSVQQGCRAQLRPAGNAHQAGRDSRDSANRYGLRPIGSRSMGHRVLPALRARALSHEGASTRFRSQTDYEAWLKEEAVIPIETLHAPARRSSRLTNKLMNSSVARRRCAPIQWKKMTHRVVLTLVLFTLAAPHRSYAQSSPRIRVLDPILKELFDHGVRTVADVSCTRREGRGHTDPGVRRGRHPHASAYRGAIELRHQRERTALRARPRGLHVVTAAADCPARARAPARTRDR